jgi:hypothetical protein
MPAGIQRVPAGQKHHKTTKPQLSSFCIPKMLSTSAPLSPHPLSPTRKRVLSPALEHVPKRHTLSVGDKKLSSAPAQHLSKFPSSNYSPTCSRYGLKSMGYGPTGRSS